MTYIVPYGNFYTPNIPLLFPALKLVVYHLRLLHINLLQYLLAQKFKMYRRGRLNLSLNIARL